MESLLLIGVGCWRLLCPLAHHDGCPEVTRGYSLTTQSEIEALRDSQHEAVWTYVEDLKDQLEVLFPTRNRIFIAHCVEESGSHISFALLDNLLLYLRHRSVS